MYSHQPKVAKPSERWDFDDPSDWRNRSFPPTEVPLTSLDIASLGWNALQDLILPVPVLIEKALDHNLNLMAQFCRESKVDLAPHCKTTMSPQLVLRQLQAGAWAITAASLSQARILSAWGVDRILVANQVVDPVDLELLASELALKPKLEVYCLVDSTACVELMERAMARAGLNRKLPVLIELGLSGGRAGCRTRAEARRVAIAVASSRRLQLAGVEGYEGVVEEPTTERSIEKVDAFLAEFRRLAVELDADGFFQDVPEIVVTAGGSAYFDRVVQILRGLRLNRPTRVVLRSGRYLIHDADNYEGTGPMGTRLADWKVFIPALEVWGVVLSRPEPELAILGFGLRDVSSDQGFPRPVKVRKRETQEVRSAPEMEILRLNDHHAYLHLNANDDLVVGDQIGSGLCHPCTVFDKWRVIPIVDDAYNVTGVVQTFF